MLSHQIHWHFYNILFIILLRALFAYPLIIWIDIFVFMFVRGACTMYMYVFIACVRAWMRVYVLVCKCWYWYGGHGCGCVYIKDSWFFWLSFYLSVCVISFCKLSRNHSNMTESNRKILNKRAQAHTQRWANGRTDRQIVIEA